MSETKADMCPICQAGHLHGQPTHSDSLKYDCPACGLFQITGSAHAMLPKDNNERSKISAYVRWRKIRNMPSPTIFSSRSAVQGGAENSYGIEDILAWFPKTLADRLDCALLNLHALSEFPGDTIQLTRHDYPVCLAENHSAMDFILRQFNEQGYLALFSATSSGYHFSLAVDAWNRIADLQRTPKGANARKVFVAMWIDKATDDAYFNGIKKAIEATGYEAVRIDLKEHNQKICDLIMSEIRHTGFLVADFTGHRHGVYFEAGFALGLGLPVIWTCRKQDIENAHFDTRQYNHILWETADELCTKLKNRVLATIPMAK